MVAALLSGVTAVAFGLLYQVSGWTLVVGGIVGAVSWAFATLLGHLPGAGFLGDFVGALIVGGLSEIAAYVRHEPVLVFVVPAIIAFVPGDLVYQSMVAFLKSQFEAGLQSGLSALFSAGAISLGLALATAVIRPLIRRSRI
ncbi:threonine/serine exporter [Sulfobacillus sp. DSM 109850]|uniref:Threonine/serine exporter n=1 Tax=Sulfobacillus harzensis TaxID=2729629 RepID=A0A7Y0L0M0_9FIRM|nr:threonine/serine exporter [Sulfobacillus harzensis]